MMRRAFAIILIALFGSVTLSAASSHAAISTWTQTDWSAGVGPNTVDQYSAATDVDAAIGGQFTLASPADWFDLDWKYRREVTVTNVGAAETDYQVRIIVPYDAGMQADFDDLRFANDNGVELDYWLHYKTDSVEAVVWVEVDALAAGDTTVFMYFGNDAAASTSSGEDTFPFFDGFDDGVIDPGKWLVTDPGGYVLETGGKLVFERTIGGGWTTAVMSVLTFARDDISFETDYEWVANNPSYDAIMYGWHDSGTGVSYTNLVYAYYNPGTGGGTTVPVSVYEDGSGRAGETGVWILGTDYDIRVRMRASGGAFYEQSDDGGDTWATNYTSTYSTESDLKPAWSFYAGTHHYDNARVRQWMAVEPTSVFGATEERYALTGSLISNAYETHEAGAIWGVLNYTVSGAGTTVVKVRTSDDPAMADAPDFALCVPVAGGTDLENDNCVEDGHSFIQYAVELTAVDVDTPVFEEISIEFESAEVIANAGHDQTMAAGRSLTLDGTASAGVDLSYNWALISGDGSLENIQSPTPTYTVDADAPYQDVEIHLTVRSSTGLMDSDVVIIHVMAIASGEQDHSGIVGDVNGTIIYEHSGGVGGGGRVILNMGNAELVLPENTGDYALNATSAGQLIVGVPNTDDATGIVYLLTQPLGNQSGAIEMGGASQGKRAPAIDFDSGLPVISPVDFSQSVVSSSEYITILGNQEGDLFGQYLAAGDVDSDGDDEILIAAPGAADFGMVYIYDTQFNLLGVLVGTQNYPVNSLFVGNYLAGGLPSVSFGPGNPAQNLNLSLSPLASVDPSDFVFAITNPNYFTGITVMDAAVVEATTGAGTTYQALALGDLIDGGVSDLILGSDTGGAYIYFGQQAVNTERTLADANVVLSGGSTDTLFGRTVAYGDVSGDALVDVIIGAPHYGAERQGALFVIFGMRVWEGAIDVATSGRVLVLVGENSDDQIGRDLLIADRFRRSTKAIDRRTGCSTMSRL